MDKAKKPQLKKIRELLKERSARDKERVFVAEGAKLTLDALNKNRDVISVFISGRVVGSPSAKEITSICQREKIELFRVAAVEFEKLSSLNNSQGILALVRRCPENIEKTGKFSVLCDGIQDPGNLGTIIRTSAAFGISSVFLLGATVDLYNPKVVRSSSGTIMDVRVSSLSEEDLDRLRSEGSYLISASSNKKGAKMINEVKIPDAPVIIAFGNEGRGLSNAVINRSDDIFYIPIAPEAESLNVTAAAAIAIYHFTPVRKVL